MIEVCPVCGKEFEVNGPKKYCSISCRNIAANIRRCPTKEKVCIICGEKFMPLHTSAKYCSKECQLKNKRKRKTIFQKTCKFCGNNFETLNPNQIYCSNICQIKNQNMNNKDRKRFSGKRHDVLERDNRKCLYCGKTDNLIVHHRDETGQTENINNDDSNLITLCRSCHIKIYHPKKITNPERYKVVDCQYCGKEFTTTQERIDANRGKYCSVECADKAKEKKVPMNCEYCGKEFFVTPSRAKRGKVKYDSMECRKAAGYAHRSK